MSNRTAQANKAIATAWQKEQELVREGKGTRNWTPEQQQDILDRGKAYDENGKAFEGHHMKNVEMYPEYQGNPDNIQFLSRAEHFAAHNGNYQNLTNGYYNTATGKTVYFEGGKCTPCEIIYLSNPIASLCKELTYNMDGCSNSAVVPDSPESAAKSTRSLSSNASKVTLVGRQPANAAQAKPAINPKKRNFFQKIRHIIRSVSSWCKAHPFVAKVLSGIGVTVIATAVYKRLTNSSSVNGSSLENNDDYYGISFADYGHGTDFEDDCGEYKENSSDGNEDKDSLECETHISPAEHTVRSHRQRYNGEWKEKESYTRGGRNTENETYSEN